MTENSNTNTTDYAGNYIYKDGSLEFFSHPEGYVEPEASGYNYVYQYKDHLGNIRLSYSNPNDSYQNIVDSDLTNSMDGWQHNGNSSSEFIDGSLKVTVDSAWEGIRHNLADLSVAPGDVFNIRLAFDKGTTQAKVRLYFRELDANGNHLSWNMINGDLQTGNHHNYNYTVNAGSKLVLRIAKDDTYTQDVTHFFVDHISVTQGNLEIVEENNYYPFGLKHKGYNNIQLANHPYKYNGKELNEELGLDWYDLGARNLDPALGRFMNLDPKAESYRYQSTYTFAVNNPVFFIDINGEGVEDDYGIDQNGKIELIKKTDDATDTLYSVTRGGDGELIKDENGEVVKNDTGFDGVVDENDSVTVEKGVLDNIENTNYIDSDGITRDIQIMEVTNSGKNKELFEFMSANSNNEFSYSSWFSNREFISTSFESNAENSINILFPRYKSLLHHVHSHPDPYLSPSPGDNSVAKIISKRVGYKPRFEIYSPILNQYMDYDENTPFDTFEPVIINVKKKKN